MEGGFGREEMRDWRYVTLKHAMHNFIYFSGYSTISNKVIKFVLVKLLLV